jgi:tetratricopeptide (TPR) repeat protein
MGLVLVPSAAVLIVAGRRPPGAILAASALLIALGGWGLLSTLWGGLPHTAWLDFDRTVVAASALLVGSGLTAKPGRRGLILAAVLVGIVIHAVVVLVRLGLPAHPDEWLQGRFLQGPVGYHNAQGLLFAIAIPLALWAADNARVPARVGGGTAAAVLASGVLLTQSRGALLGAAAAVAIQAIWARRASAVMLAATLVVVAGGLFLALQDVDAALLTQSPEDAVTALRWYLLATVGAAAIVAAVAAVAHSHFVLRGTAVAVVVLLAAGVAAVAYGRTSLFTATFSLPGLATEPAATSPAGTTRITTLAPGGRLDAWRVARSMAADDPVLGAGEGQFSRRWAKDRDIPGLYIRHAHSLELQLLAELGSVGLGIFLLVIAAVGGALARTSRRTIAAAAMGTGVALLVDASVDWTWSFLGIVAPALLVIGAAVGSRPLGFPGRAATSISVLVAVGLSLALLLPYLADRRVDRARTLLARDGAGAWSQLEAARRVDPWNAEALSLEGLVAENGRRYALAADRFEAAAANSERPWTELLHLARTFAQSGDLEAARAACERAVSANPAEPSLYGGPCAYEVAANRWPVAVARGIEVPAGEPFSAFYVDRGCEACALRLSGSELIAETQGEPDARDSAYAAVEISPRDGQDRVVIRDIVRLLAEQRIETPVVVLQLLDRTGQIILELFVRSSDGTLAVYSPPLGLRREALNRGTGVALDPGGPARQVEIAVLGHVLHVRIDGADRLRLEDLRGAARSEPALIRVGIVGRIGWSPNRPLRIAHGGVVVTPG